jgi:hypothetical protein
MIGTFCFAVLLAGAQTTTPATTAAPMAAVANGTIRGHVVAADSGQPLRKAEVRLVPIGPLSGGMPDRARQPRTARTDVDGKYEFTDVAAARYAMSVSKPPYVEENLGQLPPNNKPIEVHGGETLDRVDFSLKRGGVITGRVVDEFGEPLSGVQARIVQARTINGRRDLQEMNFASTNDLGEFRMFGIAPGQYHVKVSWRRMGMPMDADSPDRTGYADTFFPGTVNVEEAQRLTVRAGETVSDLMIALSPLKTVRLEGSVADVNGKALGQINVIVMKGDGNGGGVFGAMVKPDGTFIVGNLTPGEYMLRAQSTPPRKESAELNVTVGSDDIKNVRLIAVPPSTVSGRVIVDPAQAQSLTNPLRIALMTVERNVFNATEPARVGDDLSFELSAGAGRYRINWMNLPPGWMIRTIRINNTDVTDDDIEVKAGENISGVDIELTNKTATIAGAVSVRSGVPSTDYRLIVFAADKKLWTPNSRYFRMGGPDKDGRFKVAGLPPGNYNVVALERVEIAVPFNDAEFLQRISANADTVTLADGESRTIELRLTSIQP